MMMAENNSNTLNWPTDCPFAEVGCNSSLLSSKEYSQHLAQNTEQHLQMIVDLHKGTEIISPLQKLNGVKSEIEFLEGTLESLGVRQIPALECIKTQIKLPDVTINSLGDRCAFRMPGFVQLRGSSQTWLSPTFLIRGGYKLCLVVHPNGTGAGKGTHVSVFLVLQFGDQLELPITLPRHLGIRVELLAETDGSVSDSEGDLESDENPCSSDGQNDHTYEFTWRPKSAKGNTSQKINGIASQLPTDTQQTTVKHQKLDELEQRRRISKILPPWCQPPPDISEQSIDSTKANSKSMMTKFPVAVEGTQSNDSSRVATSKKQRRSGVSGRGETNPQQNGVTLVAAEKFASQDQVEHLVREFNSLVFQISLCLV